MASFYINDSSASEHGNIEDDCVDLSGRGYTEFPDLHVGSMDRKGNVIRNLQLHHNDIGIILPSISSLKSLTVLDMSNNNLMHIAEEITTLCRLHTLELKNNQLDQDSLPKTLSLLQNLTTLNLGGNRFSEFPSQLFNMPNIRQLSLASNSITDIPNALQDMQGLEILNMGDNLLQSIPDEIGQLFHLTSLNLASNRLVTLPKTLMHLRHLRSLYLHNNRLSTLPPEIVSVNLVELSLRNNPLVVRFVQSMMFDPPTLLELSGRIIKLKNIPYNAEGLPAHLYSYLHSANNCVNPKCRGVFFTSKVEHVKFVDFCGKYRLPLLQYLCSPKCSTSSPMVEGSSDSESDEEMRIAHDRMKRVLLG